MAFALFSILAEIGPSSLLQTDNVGEFSNHEHDHVGHQLLLDNKCTDLVILEPKNLWPECQMLVCGSPRRHSKFKSNGSVERVNQTVQRKLGG